MEQATTPCAQPSGQTGATFEEILFQNVPALFTTLRVRENGVPEGLQRYEIRHENGDPCQIARSVLVDHYGTLLTSDPIQLPADGYLAISPEDLVLSSGVRVAPADFLRRHPPAGEM